MIDRAEILRLAGELGLRPDVVEKDYVLGWLLAVIGQDDVLGPAWVFKGGTCLKKCFFETYRFSEDLDFTVTDPAHLDRDFLIERFRGIAASLYDKSGIELPVELLRFDIYENPRGKRAGQGRISYRGPIARGGDLPRVKLDLTSDEVLVMPAVTRPVTHPYSDGPDEGFEARCYAFEEVFGEKVRALGERSRPRDLYDVINLFRNGEFTAAASAIHRVVTEKCAFKAVPFPTLEALSPFRDELVGEWNNMLAHQLPALPPIQSFLDALPEFFAWLAGQKEPVVLAAHPMARNTEVLRGPAGVFGDIGGHQPSIETIRFAAANRLCVELDYRDEQGRRDTRLIEAYSLRRTQAGDVLLMAARVDSGAARSYRLDRILGARVTQQVFVPRYPVELTPTGPLSIRDTERGSGSSGGGISSRGRLSPVVRTRRTTARWPAATGPKYVFRCSVCGKEFERSSYDANLRPHKNRSKIDCYGTIGIYVRTKH